jgi:hypothetical protein
MNEDQIRTASDKLARLCEVERYEIRADTPKAQVRKVIEAVCERHEVAYTAVMSRSRFADIVAARHEAIVAVATAFPWMSLPKIGRVFGRDHTSILHALDKFGVPRRTQGHEARDQNYRPNALALGRIFKQLGEALDAKSKSLEVEIQEPASANGGRVLCEQEGTPRLDEPETQGTSRGDNPASASGEVQVGA